MSGELNPKFSFESLVVGPGNELATTAAEAVAARPGEMYNPLYVHGGPGVGKTHLLMAVGHAAAAMDPPRSVEYVTPERLAEAFNAAASAGQMEAFRHRLADVDVLLIDDAHLLDRRREIQGEIARLIPEAQAAGRHVLLAGQRPPSEIDSLDETLESLLGSGLVVGIAAPEYEARLAILNARARERSAGLEQDVLEAIAEFDLANVRELSALLNRLIALDAVSESPLTPEAARLLLEGEALTKDDGPRYSSSIRLTPGEDEFADFLSDVSTTVAQQVEVWEANVVDAIERWRKEGVKTDRLEGLLGQAAPIPVDAAIQDFERDAERVISLRNSVATVDADRANDPVFKDPDRVSEAESVAESVLPKAESLPGPSPAWTFSSYERSEANRQVDETVEVVLKTPGSARNPLVIVGRTGVGKTHLLHAIGNSLMSAVGSEVVCLASREFSEMVDSAARAEGVNVLRTRLLEGGALLVDDVHLLAGNEEANKALLDIMSGFVWLGRQVIFTINCPPADLAGISEDLVAQLSAASTLALMPPDRELRRTLAERTFNDHGVDADSELVDYLGDRPADSVRAVVGLVQRVIEAADARGLVPSAGLARELIEGALTRSPRRSGALRTSGVLVSTTGAIRSREKMIWSWPDPGARLIEDLT